MNLHDDRKIFAQYIEATASYMKLADAGIVEKDYFVTYFLQMIIRKQPFVIFKGGTSLSKCHKIIDRFSEDIDLDIDTGAVKPTAGQRKKLKQDIVSIIDEAGFSLENADQIRSRRDFNRYVIDYKALESYGYLKQYLIVETSVAIKSFPAGTKSAASFIYDFLFANKAENEIEKYSLAPFEVTAQAIERTFVDKVFALADYYLDGQIKSHSRHLYDLFKLYPKITFDEKFAKLVAEVREVRKPHGVCRSAQDGVYVPGLLSKIVNGDVYKSDYNQVTDALLFNQLPYSTAITVLNDIIDDGFFA